MTWFAANALQVFERVDGRGERWSVWENVLLIEASSFEEARVEAERISKEEAEADDTWQIDGHPARCRFLGIRRLQRIMNPTEYDPEQSERPPMSGTEITFSEFEVATKEDLEKLAAGEEVPVLYLP